MVVSFFFFFFLPTRGNFTYNDHNSKDANDDAIDNDDGHKKAIKALLSAASTSCCNWYC